LRFGPAASVSSLSALAARAHRLGTDPVILLGDSGTLSAVLQYRQSQGQQ